MSDCWKTGTVRSGARATRLDSVSRHRRVTICPFLKNWGSQLRLNLIWLRSTRPGPGLGLGMRRRKDRLQHAGNCGDLAKLKSLFGRGRRKQMHRAGDQTTPPGLMARSQAGAVVAVEVLIERDAIAPVGVFLKLFGSSVHWPATVMVQ